MIHTNISSTQCYYPHGTITQRFYLHKTMGCPDALTNTINAIASTALQVLCWSYFSRFLVSCMAVLRKQLHSRFPIFTLGVCVHNNEDRCNKILLHISVERKSYWECILKNRMRRWMIPEWKYNSVPYMQFIWNIYCTYDLNLIQTLEYCWVTNITELTILPIVKVLRKANRLHSVAGQRYKTAHVISWKLPNAQKWWSYCMVSFLVRTLPHTVHKLVR